MSHEDDARPIPQGAVSSWPSPPVEEDHDPFLVDTRGRRRLSRGRNATQRPGGRPVAPAPGRPRRAAAPPPRAAEAGSALPEPPRRRRHPVRWVLVLLVVVLVGWVGYTAYTPYHAWSSVSRVDSTPSAARGAAPSGGHVYLLVGSDSRAGLTAAQRRRLGTGSVVGQRTDSIILVYVPDGGGKSALISIPRDSYVPIPGHGSNKINAAYALGGPRLLVETVEQATDLRIDGYLEVGFGGFVSVVDGLGGVDICVPFRMNDPKAHINLKKGCQTLTGPTALGYVRARYSDPRGDIGRAERQRQFLGAIMKKVARPSTVLNPVTWWRTTHDIAGALTVGTDTSLMDGERIAMTMRQVSQGAALSLVVPLADTNYQTSAGSSVKWDTERAKALFTMLRRGEPLTAPPAGTDGKPSGG